MLDFSAFAFTIVELLIPHNQPNLTKQDVVLGCPKNVIKTREKVANGIMMITLGCKCG
jgi:hypothetical protein